jgi:hypothetical protein
MVVDHTSRMGQFLQLRTTRSINPSRHARLEPIHPARRLIAERGRYSRPAGLALVCSFGNIE